MLFFAAMSQDSWESVAEFGFWMVLIGVALEIVDLAFKWKRHRKEASILVKESFWFLVIETASVGLIVLGLGIELWGSHQATSLARKKSDQLTRDLTNAKALLARVQIE